MIDLSNLVVVGIAGRARAGKDTAASALIESWSCVRIALADAVKGAFDDLSGITRGMHKDLDVNGLGNRWAWQQLGSEARVAVPGGNLLWVHAVLAKIYYMAAIHPKVHRQFVVPDLRYPYEHVGLRDVIHGWGGRYGTMLIQRPVANGVADHSSETNVDSIPADFVYPNEQTILDLRNHASWFFGRVGRGFYLPTATLAPDVALIDAEAA